MSGIETSVDMESYQSAVQALDSPVPSRAAEALYRGDAELARDNNCSFLAQLFAATQGLFPGENINFGADRFNLKVFY